MLTPSELNQIDTPTLGNNLVGISVDDNLLGSESKDVLSGNGGADILVGLGDDDILFGDNGNDTLFGDAGNDTLNGGNGNDSLTGGAGNDTLNGGAGDDSFHFGNGGGQDTVIQSDSYSTADKLVFGAGITLNDVWFSQSGNHLLINLAGTDDQMTINNWYSGTRYQFDSIETGSSVLLNNQVDQLVSAMASYSVPIGAGNVIPQDVKDALQPVLADTWQAA